MYKTISILCAAALILGVGAIASAQGPAVWLKFDEGSGAAANDSSGNNNHGSVQDGAGWSTDVDTTRQNTDLGPSCLSLTKGGQNDWDKTVPWPVVKVNHHTSLNAGLGAVTMCFFVKISTTGTPLPSEATFVQKGSTNSGDGSNINHLGKRYQMYYKNAQLNAVVDDGDALPPPDEDLRGHKAQYQSPANPGVVTGNWVHVAATIDMAARAAKMYLDGTELTGCNLLGGWPVESIDEPTELYIGNTYIGEGGDTYPDSFTGLMDDVRVYMRALTATEIQGIAAFQPTPTPTATNTPTPTPAGAQHWEIFD